MKCHDEKEKMNQSNTVNFLSKGRESGEILNRFAEKISNDSKLSYNALSNSKFKYYKE
ncbi:MAG: hypothetical protein WC188_03690 [Candidatus Caldatribacteriota bacterium]|jgi:hypothetical protein